MLCYKGTFQPRRSLYAGLQKIIYAKASLAGLSIRAILTDGFASEWLPALGGALAELSPEPRDHFFSPPFLERITDRALLNK